MGSLVGEYAPALEGLEAYFANNAPPLVRGILARKKKRVLNQVITGSRVLRQDSIAEPLAHGFCFLNVVAGTGGVRTQNETDDVEGIPGQKFSVLILVYDIVGRSHNKGEVLHSLGIVTDSGKGLDLRQLIPPEEKELI